MVHAAMVTGDHIGGDVVGDRAWRRSRAMGALVPLSSKLSSGTLGAARRIDSGGSAVLHLET